MFTVAIIGYGYWGPKLSRNFHNSKNFEIKYIIDKSKKKLNECTYVPTNVRIWLEAGSA